MIVLSWSKATRDLLKSLGWGIRALHQLGTATMVPSPRRLPHTISPLEGDGFEPSVPREDEPRKGAVDPLTPADSKAPHHDRPAARKADSNSSVAGHRELRFSRQGGAGAAASRY